VDVAVAQNQDGRLEVFYIGANTGIVYHQWQNLDGSGTWSGEYVLGAG
jgi:hypothetical protein